MNILCDVTTRIHVFFVFPCSLVFVVSDFSYLLMGGICVFVADDFHPAGRGAKSATLGRYLLSFSSPRASHVFDRSTCPSCVVLQGT